VTVVDVDSSRSKEWEFYHSEDDCFLSKVGTLCCIITIVVTYTYVVINITNVVIRVTLS